jgi:hypothetical protein
MQMKDIQTGVKYMAKVGYNRSTPVEVTETGVERKHGYRSQTQRNGVRVKTCTPARIGYGLDISPAGTEVVLASREITRPWTEADDERAEKDAANAREQVRLEGELEARGIVGTPHGSGFRFSFAEVSKLLGEYERGFEDGVKDANGEEVSD